MAYYLASYDYHRQRDYTMLYKLMGHLGAIRILQSAWLVEANVSAKQLRDAMIACGDGDESFAVIELVPGADWATMLVPGNAGDWLSDNVTPGGPG